MFKIICVTSRGMCDDFFERVGELYKNGVTVILREKDLSESEYERLAKSVIEVCPDVILHSYTDAAKRLGVKKIHLPLHKMYESVKNDFETVGISVHSAEEAVEAERMGADYVTAGHVFSTDCKKGLAPRGTEYLKSVVNAVKIPVYGIGGILPDNIVEIKTAGACGACIMSGFMKCENIEKYLAQINKNLLKK
ncbi:MAG: thiamine phosphate synthase [Hominilimicola sp.]